MKTMYIKHIIIGLLLLGTYAFAYGRSFVKAEQAHDSTLCSKATLYLPYKSVEGTYFTGVVSVISAEELAQKMDLNVLSSLKGLAAGLYISENPAENRDAGYDITIRGLNSSSLSSSAPLILVDGVQRPIEFIQVADIESVTILKDAVSKASFKGKAVNGIISIKTKRGQVNKEVKNIQLEMGSSSPQHLPSYLPSYEYANLYNLARRNTGLTNLYTTEEIEGYKNPSIRFPSNDYYNSLIKDNATYLKATSSFSGGTDKLSYFLGLAYLHSGGIEAVGEANGLNQFSIRTNLDYSISPVLDAYLDIYGFLDNNKSNYIRGNELFSRMSTQRPNEYAFLLKDHYIPDSVLYGAGRLSTLAKYQNLYAEMLKGGMRENTKRVGQMNLGFKLDMSSVLEGLSGKLGLSYDTYNYTSIGKNDDFYSFLPIVWDGNQPVEYVQVTAGKKNSGMSNLGSDGYKQYTVLAQLDYAKACEEHRLQASLTVDAEQRENQYEKLKNKNQSNTLLFHYTYKDKYIAEGNASLLGSSKLASSKRYGLFPSLGLAWILSKEEFFSLPKVDFLKLKASYGVSASDDALDFFSYQTRWSYYKNYTYFGSDAKNEVNTTQIYTFAPTVVDWEKSKEFNLGVEVAFMKHFYAEANYYHLHRSNIPILAEDVFSQIWGITSMKMNYAEIKNNGFDFTVAFRKKTGYWNVEAKANANYSLANYTKSTSWAGLPPERNLTGKAVDTYIGLKSEGLIKTSADLLASLPHSFGSLSVGDLRYANLNGDDRVDEKDMTDIGNSFPRIQFGLYLSVGYKAFGLVVSGYGAAMYDLYLNTPYHRPGPEIAYSKLAKQAFNPETGEGVYPKLSVDDSSNNYQLSNFWLASGNFFKIKDVEMHYTLPASVTNRVLIEKIKVFAKVNNLATFTAIKDLDPECLLAGQTRYPFMRTISGGLQLTF